VVVGGAAKLVGKKVKARISALTVGIAWAELVEPVEQGDEPLTAEAEAERPTRAKKSAIAAPKTEEEEPEVDAEVAVEDEAADGEAPVKKKTRRGSRGGKNRKKKPAAATGEEVPDAEGADTGLSDTVEPEPEPEGPTIHVPDRDLGAEENGDATAKKRTRRGSRGGKNRRKKPAGETATATVDAEAPPDEAGPEQSEDGDWGYTPMSEWGLEDSGEQKA
jgi:hypothetical protein